MKRVLGMTAVLIAGVGLVSVSGAYAQSSQTDPCKSRLPVGHPCMTATPVATAVLTATPLATDTVLPTATTVQTAVPTDTATPVPTDTPVPTETASPTKIPTSTPVPTEQATVIPSPSPTVSALLQTSSTTTVLVSQQGGRVDWGTNDLIVYSSIQNLSGSGTLSSELHLMYSDGSQDECITCNSAEISHISNDQPAWHPGADWILFQSVDPNLTVPGIPDSQVKQYEQGGYGYNNNLWVMRPDGSQFVQLIQVPAGGATLHPHFSPDGTKVFWSSSEPARLGGNGWVLKLADFLTDENGVPYLDNIQTITPLGVTGSQVYESHDISADNTRVMYSYSAGQPLDLDIYVTDLTTGESTNLTNAPGVWDEHAHFTPDGQHIAWISSNGYPFTPASNWQSELRTDIWLMDADGTNKQKMTNYNGSGRFIVADLAWSPDGRSLVASRSDIKASGSVLEVIRVDTAL